MNNEYRTMIKHINSMTNEELQIVWDNLLHYDPHEEYAPGVSMDEWAMAIKGQMDYRKSQREEQDAKAVLAEG